MLVRSKILVAIAVFAVALSCSREKTESGETYLEVPRHFPSVPFPEDNTYSDIRFELGKKLFFDPMLSIDSTISCGSCHKAEFAMADAFAISPGVEGRLGHRNAPSLLNVAYQPYFMTEGGLPTLEMQVLAPVQEHTEMDFNIVLIAERMNTSNTYVEMSQEAYGREPDPFVITRALANYERTFISGSSRYDTYRFYGNSGALSPSEKRGLSLFRSEKTQCSVCHSGLFFTSYEFENNGLDSVYSDIGRMRLTGDSADEALFKIPSLRNVEYSAPYMHDGRFATLEEVVEHYNSGGANHPHKSERVRPLNLTQQERIDLVAFLRSLSDPSVQMDERFLE
ncbi:MAG: cytochrome-c peroxidase [Bacteroidetes bacterium]|nr:MAG: cytochrome-c peroxidase [Bacteroidota bacterium]